MTSPTGRKPSEPQLQNLPAHTEDSVRVRTAFGPDANTVKCTCTPSRGLRCTICWLNPIIASQAAHYGLTEERFTSLMSDVAEYQEIADTELGN